MRKIFFLTALIIQLCFWSFAQHTDSLRYIYNNQTIYRFGSWFMKGSERLTFGELQTEFSMSDIGLVSYMKARKYKTTSTILRYASFAASIVSVAILTSNNNRNTYYALLGGQALLALGSGTYGLLSAQSLDRALWQRNKDLLFPGR